MAGWCLAPRVQSQTGSKVMCCIDSVHAAVDSAAPCAIAPSSATRYDLPYKYLTESPWTLFF